MGRSLLSAVSLLSMLSCRGAGWREVLRELMVCRHCADSLLFRTEQVAACQKLSWKTISMARPTVRGLAWLVGTRLRSLVSDPDTPSRLRISPPAPSRSPSNVKLPREHSVVTFPHIGYGRIPHLRVMWRRRRISSSVALW